MSVQYQDYYKVLGVSKKSTQQEIQKAYRKLARKYHPDVNKEKSAEEKFKKITEAYEVLKSPESRKKYDTLGQNWKAGDPFTPPQGWQNVPFNFGGQAGDASGFSNFFDMFFGQSFSGARSNGGPTFWDQSGRPQQKGEDQEGSIEISLEEAHAGVQKDLSFQTARGSAAGNIKRVKVSIPPGATDGTRLRFRGQGGESRSGGPAGDLLLRVKLSPHPIFTAQGHNLKCLVPVTPWEAALGSKVEVPTLTGKVKLTIPEGTQSGHILRLKGKGLPLKKDGHGDLFVEVQIAVPKNLTPKEKELFEALSKASHFSPR